MYFFGCKFSAWNWKWCRIKLLWPASQTETLNLDSEVEILTLAFNSKCIGCDIAKTTFPTCVWTIWKERNSKIFFKNRETYLSTNYRDSQNSNYDI